MYRCLGPLETSAGNNRHGRNGQKRNSGDRSCFWAHRFTSLYAFPLAVSAMMIGTVTTSDTVEKQEHGAQHDAASFIIDPIGYGLRPQFRENAISVSEIGF